MSDVSDEDLGDRISNTGSSSESLVADSLSATSSGTESDPSEFDASSTNEDEDFIASDSESLQYFSDVSSEAFVHDSVDHHGPLGRTVGTRPQRIHAECCI